MKPDGSLLEGYSSNFYIVVTRGIAAAIVTAAGGAVHFGSFRRLQSRLAADQGVTVELRPSNRGERAQLLDAFLTSTSQVVLQLDEVLGGRYCASTAPGKTPAGSAHKGRHRNGS